MESMKIQFQKLEAAMIEGMYNNLMNIGESLLTYDGEDLFDRADDFNTKSFEFADMCYKYEEKYEPNGSIVIDEFTYNIASINDALYERINGATVSINM